MKKRPTYQQRKARKEAKAIALVILGFIFGIAAISPFVLAAGSMLAPH